MEKEYNIRSIERALNVLKCFDADRKEIGLLEFVELMELNKSTVYRILTNLKNAGFVDMNSDKKYTIGSEILRLANLRMDDEFLIKMADKLLEMLADLSGETVILVKYDNYKATCIDKVESNKTLKIVSEIGKKVPIMKGATGKSIAAFLNDDELNKCIDVQKNIFNENYDLDKLKREFEVIRREGYSVTTSEVDKCVTAFAIPIFGMNGVILGSISVAGPDSRFDDEAISTIKEKAIEETNELSYKIGYGNK